MKISQRISTNANPIPLLLLFLLAFIALSLSIVACGESVDCPDCNCQATPTDGDEGDENEAQDNPTIEEDGDDTPTEDGDDTPTEDGDDTPAEDGDDTLAEDGDDTTENDVEPVDAPIVLNEIDCYGRDWVEIANTSGEDFDASGWMIADDLETEGHQYTLPAGSIVPANGYLVVKEENEVEQGFPFGLKCGSDTAYLLAPNGWASDNVWLPEVPDGYTFGRIPDMTGDWRVINKSQGEANVPPNTRGTFLFSPQDVYNIDISLDPDSEAALIANPFDYVQASVTFSSGETVYDPMIVGLRLKSGLSFQPLDQKPALKIKFTKYEDNQRFMGLKNLTLNSMVDDPTMIKEALVYRLFRFMNAPGPYNGYAWVRINGQNYGLYLALEKYDDVTAGQMFDTTQHIYEGTGDLYLGQTDSFEVDFGDKDDISDLTAFLDTINNTPDNEWFAAMQNVFNFDAFYKMWALENFVGHFDGYAHAANNYFLHVDGNGQFTMMPWGMDRTFSDTLEMESGTSVVASKCLSISACREGLVEALALIAPVAAAMPLDEYVSTLSNIVAPYVEQDPRRPNAGSMTQFYDGVDALESYIDTQMSTVEGYEAK